VFIEEGFLEVVSDGRPAPNAAAILADGNRVKMDDGMITVCDRTQIFLLLSDLVFY
jgi:hypothetical protein